MSKAKTNKKVRTDKESAEKLTDEWLCALTGKDGVIERYQSGYFRSEKAWIFEFSSVNRLVVKPVDDGVFSANLSIKTGIHNPWWQDDIFLCELRTHDQLVCLLKGLGYSVRFLI